MCSAWVPAYAGTSGVAGPIGQCSGDRHRPDFRPHPSNVFLNSSADRANSSTLMRLSAVENVRSACAKAGITT